MQLILSTMQMTSTWDFVGTRSTATNCIRRLQRNASTCEIDKLDTKPCSDTLNETRKKYAHQLISNLTVAHDLAQAKGHRVEVAMAEMEWASGLR